MRILRVDPGDAAAVRKCFEVQEAAKQAEDPLGPPKTERVLRVFLAEGFEANPCEAWLCLSGETPLGWYWLELPDQENLDRGTLIIVLRPGSGPDVERALLRHAAQRAAASGRTILTLMARQGSQVDAFLASAGATHVHVEVRRVLDLRAAPPGHFTALYEAASRHADGYSLVRWSGVTPDEHLAGVAQVLNAMNDAPHEEGLEESVWDADRVRERADSSLLRMGVRGYSVAAVHDATGEMAALTQLEVDPDDPEWGHQGLTAVTRPHRGHRLGLLVKAVMTDWLADAEPQVHHIETGNADVNQWMIAVNEALGFTILDPSWEWRELPVATAQASHETRQADHVEVSTLWAPPYCLPPLCAWAQRTTTSPRRCPIYISLRAWWTTRPVRPGRRPSSGSAGRSARRSRRPARPGTSGLPPPPGLGRWRAGTG